MEELQHLDEYRRLALPKAVMQARGIEDAQNLIESGGPATATYVQVLRMQEYLKSYADTLKPSVINDLEGFNQKETIRVLGATLSLMEAGTVYDYEVCNDPEYQELVKQEKKAIAMRKKREAFLRNLTGVLEIHDPETGELHRIFPPVKKSTTVPKVVY